MSAFDNNNTPADPNPITENFLDNLVGEGKKFLDPEALAKGKYEADVHVTNLERQLAELRTDLDQGTKITELMELVREQHKPAPVVDPNASPVVPGDTSSGQMTEDELKSLIEQHVSERDKQTSVTKNITDAEKALEDKYGESAVRVITSRAAELGMTVDQMKELAGTSPKVFSRLVGLDDRASFSGTFLGETQRSEGATLKSADTRNFAFYQEMRKKNRAHYYSPKVQMQMMKDREAMGREAFGT